MTIHQLLLEESPKMRLLVLGDLMLDHWVWGSVSRISPEAPIPVVDVERYSYTPGGAANVVANLLSLGAHVTLAGVVGKDDSGRRLRSLLRRQGVDVSGVLFDPGRPTTLKTRIVAHAQQVVRADYEKKHPLSPTMEAAVLEWLMLALPQFQAVFLSDYLKGFFTPTLVASIAAACASRAIPLVVGPKPANVPLFRGVSLLTLNAREAAEASGVATSTQTGAEAAGAILQSVIGQGASPDPGTPSAGVSEGPPSRGAAAGGTEGGIKPGTVVVTRGENGMSMFSPGEPPRHMPALASQVYDVSGAGDTVLASLGLAVAGGLSPADAVLLASHAAAVVVRKIGTATATPEEILGSLDNFKAGKRKR